MTSMPVEIKVPSVGESITEGSIARWIKSDGDRVAQDDPLFELETEKATQEVPAPAAGVLRIKVKAGERVAIGSVVGTIEEGAGAPARPRSPVPAAPARDDARPRPPERPAPAPGKQPQPTAGLPMGFSPAARAKVAEHGIDPGTLHGTGRHGVVLKEDVPTRREEPRAPARPADKPVAPPAPPAPADPTLRETRQPMSAIRQRIAERLLAAQKGTASLTTFNEADLSAVIELRNRYKDRFKEKHDVGLGFMSFFVKAAVEALKAYPQVNARIDGTDLVLQHSYNIGVAVSTEKGLMVPVLRDADRLSFAEIEKAVASAAARARDGKIGVADLQGGTFTITNGGIFGSMMSTPILNPPQAAILGMHAIQKRPVVRDDQVVVRPMMYLALTYDHRIIDGREAVLFLVRIKEGVEDPERLLLAV
jgi:2-oxoglutarate dehydrogenase E2 component (dihydrolipoamide succinyltransferase)